MADAGEFCFLISHFSFSLNSFGPLLVLWVSSARLLQILWLCFSKWAQMKAGCPCKIQSGGCIIKMEKRQKHMLPSLIHFKTIINWKHLKSFWTVDQRFSNSHSGCTLRTNMGMWTKIHFNLKQTLYYYILYMITCEDIFSGVWTVVAWWS